MTNAADTALTAVMDGNTAVAHVAYRLNEVCAIYPITPSSPMADLVDEWSARGLTNLWGSVPVVQEMQSEGGAAGAVHGALQSGALTTTFTASQGLLLMLPNMFKIAGELTAAVFHVAARALATQALSIFGEHSDVMAARTTGFALLSSGSVQEAHDAALLAQCATLETRVPFLHFFDGFRTSHELNKITVLTETELRALLDERKVRAHRGRALNPEHAFIRGTAHNPDTFFQARETVNRFYAQVPARLLSLFERFADLTGRHYHLFEYFGAPDAERVIVLMGAGALTVRATAKNLCAAAERVGVVQVRLFRPFSTEHFLTALPESCSAMAVLEQTKEPGAPGEPLYLDVIAALAQSCATGRRAHMPRVIGGRYGLGSKNFSPAQAHAVFRELARDTPRNGFTVGIDDDVSGLSLQVDPAYSLEAPDTLRAVFYGLGADGTVGATKNSAKILAADPHRYAQGYFVYDSHKSGAVTVSHLRVGPRPIEAPYLIESATFIACHHASLLERIDVLRLAARGATVLLNTPFGPDEVWAQLPPLVRWRIVTLGLRLFVIDATQVAREAGIPGRINTVLQTCFFAASGVMGREDALGRIRQSIADTYAHKGAEVVRQNQQAVDHALQQLHGVRVPAEQPVEAPLRAAVPDSAPPFVREIIAPMLSGPEGGNALKVSQLPADGTWPSGTAAYEKRNLSDTVAAWDADLCIQCGQCSFACPHSVIRAKYFPETALAGAPRGFPSAPVNSRGNPQVRYSLQVYLEDCTGCGICVEVCPAASALQPDRKAINLGPKAPALEPARAHLRYFESLPVNERADVDFAMVRGVQFLQPLFEFPGACAGCGETPYLKVLSQLFGDRLQVANATGCSSIYGGNLPATPWSHDAAGRGPAWSNSLFEDNAEFGLGFRLAHDQQRALAERRLRALAPALGEHWVEELLGAAQSSESALRAQRARIATLKERLRALDSEAARDLLSVADHLLRRSVWIVGGDGWAYDIGYGGLDHVLASGRDVNVLVLDTEVYSNTGGQSSKATPLGAIAKFAAAGKRTARKDLALQAIAYGNVYVAQIALGANPQHTLLALREAEAYPGPSLLIAYSHCIAHGFDLRYGMRQQRLATASGYWPLFRFNPAMRSAGERPFRLDSPRPTLALREYVYQELRYRALAQRDPQAAQTLLAQAEQVVREKYLQYERLASRGGDRFHPAGTP
jgi:pyruvate-ferredoxin/flavodoxin oxidoreductase